MKDDDVNNMRVLLRSEDEKYHLCSYASFPATINYAPTAKQTHSLTDLLFYTSLGREFELKRSVSWSVGEHRHISSFQSMCYHFTKNLVAMCLAMSQESIHRNVSGSSIRLSR